MRRRCPRSLPLGPARLGGYALRIALPRRAPEGPGWATAAPSPGAAVPGALYRLHRGDLEALDRYEGYPDLYLREELPVEAGGGEVRALLYRMRGPLRPAKPGADYVETLREGYRDFGLPMEVLEEALREAEIP